MDGRGRDCLFRVRNFNMGWVCGRTFGIETHRTED